LIIRLDRINPDGIDLHDYFEEGEHYNAVDISDKSEEFEENQEFLTLQAYEDDFITETIAKKAVPIKFDVPVFSLQEYAEENDISDIDWTKLADVSLTDIDEGFTVYCIDRNQAIIGSFNISYEDVARFQTAREEERVIYYSETIDSIKTNYISSDIIDKFDEEYEWYDVIDECGYCDNIEVITTLAEEGIIPKRFVNEWVDGETVLKYIEEEV
jgi:hypothetical protein